VQRGRERKKLSATLPLWELCVISSLRSELEFPFLSLRSKGFTQSSGRCRGAKKRQHTIPLGWRCSILLFATDMSSLWDAILKLKNSYFIFINIVHFFRPLLETMTLISSQRDEMLVVKNKLLCTPSQRDGM
jgi:hypothetical protein